VDPNGNVIAAWARRNENGAQVIEAAVRPAGGAWQASVRLSPEAESAEWPSLAIDPEGNAIVVWERFQGTDSEVEAAIRPAGNGVWEAPVQLSGEGAHASQPQVAVDPQGDVIAVWVRETGSGGDVIEGSVRPHGALSWQAPVALSAEGYFAQAVHIALDAQGDAVAIWIRNGIVETAERPAATGVWTAPLSLSSGLGNPHVAMDSRGDAIAIWERDHVVETSVRSVGTGVWVGPVVLSASGEEADEADISVDAAGDAIAVWQTLSGTTIDADERPQGSGAWERPVAVSVGPGQELGAFPKIAVDAAGNAVVAWDRSNGSNYIVEASTKSAASSVWQVPVAISPVSQSSYIPWVAIDPEGNAVAAWEVQSSNISVEATGYDAGPLLTGLEIPTTGTVGQPVSFSSSPLAVWSALGATSWSFGDGTSASGTSATHVYTAAGDYTVTLSSVDALGNTSSASATIAISPAHTTPTTTNAPPAITDVGLTNRHFRVGKRATAVSARKTPLGTSFHFTLSAVAKLQIRILRSTPGLRKGHLCRAPTAKLARAHAKRCTRILTVGALTRAGEAKGADSILFSGRIGHRALSPGDYTATLSASNTAGRSKPLTLRFVIVR
jgi:hypothetical protein